MTHGNSKKSKISWSKKLVRKWFNIKSKSEEYQTHEVVYEGGDVECRNSFSERDPSRQKKSRTERSRRSTERSHRKGADLDHPQVLNVNNYSVFVSTWNVAGKTPPSNLNLDNWLHSSPPADMYVLGFQEIVPLNAGNILGAEDNGPAKKWISLIRRTLNSGPGTGGSNGCYTPSPIPDPIVEWNADFGGSIRQKGSSFLRRRSFQTLQSSEMECDTPYSQPRLDRRYSVCDRAIFGNRPSDYSSCSRPNDYSYSSRPSDCSGSYRPSDFSSGYRPSDFSSGYRPSDYSWDQRPSDFSRWGVSDDDCGPEDSPSTVFYSPMSNADSLPIDDGYTSRSHTRYCIVASKQMVGLFLMVWIRIELKEHVHNMKVSCVGRGLMGYLGNKGSISVSMSLHQTSFCFICSHLTSGQKEGDELRRNSDVMEILRKTRFPRVRGLGDDLSPETILQHDRVIWLGDLNYRIAVTYRTAKALIEMQNWRALLENDQLRIEQRQGRVFEGWKEGRIYFPPTYKYSHNSDRYSGDDVYKKEKRRTPAWCDRILWHGNGLQQLSYVRGESRFSDHRPVSSVFWVEIESVSSGLRKSTSSRSRIEAEELLPYSHGYTELCFF